MKKVYRSPLSIAATAFLACQASSVVMAAGFTEALTGGKAYGDFRMRYEMVEQDNMLKDADGLILRSRLGYKTGEYNGFSALAEFEDSRVVAAMDDYNNSLGFHTQYSVIADPETTELDQAFVQYKSDSFTSKLGRQVITLDNHRFVGDVGWRQDRQTFDAFLLNFKPVENLDLLYAFLGERNRIFADASDIDSKDHLVNAAYKTSLGTVTAYAYLLEVDNNTDNALDTFGLRFNGSAKAADTKLLYTIEFASQESEAGASEFEAEYIFVEGGVEVGGITATIAYELLGSDDGAYGFSTPLATLHKFNGWTDQFLATGALGLEDIMLTLSGKLAGGKLVAVYHDFSADEASATVEDLGSEIDLLYAKKFGKNYNAGVKYAAYSAGDKASSKVDTDKFWLWVGATF
ncbi:MAG TPA: alginate export family protein [Pseudomonadales bacterium]